MKTQKIFLALLFSFSLFSCGNINKDNSSTINQDLTSYKESEDLPSSVINEKNIQSGENKFASVKDNLPVNTDRMIIRKGTMKIEIENYSESEKDLFRIVHDMNGYISNSGSSVNASGKKQGTIDIRIQAKDFDTLISEISKTGKVLSLNINSNDITEEYIDLEAREKTQKALEERLISLLNERTAKLTDVVEVEQKLADVRSQIESMQGRMRYLKNQSEYSTLSVSLFEPYLIQTASGGGFFYELSEAFKKGLEGFTDVSAGLITFAVASSPLIILMLLILYTLRKMYMKWKARKASVSIQTG